MKASKTKQLRDFIKSHEMRYFVTYSDHSGQTRIKKAFKVEINNAEYWVHFSYGDRPEVKNESIMLKTMADAKAKAKELREAHQRKKKEAADKRKERMEDVVKFLNDLSWYDYTDWDSREIKPKGQPIAEAIKQVYADMPSREKDDDEVYIRLLERYVRTGAIYTQGLSFRKEHIVCVKYGKKKGYYDNYGPVKIELINGTTIIPKSKAVMRLIYTIFGEKLDTWSFDDVKEPLNEYDKLEEHNR